MTVHLGAVLYQQSDEEKSKLLFVIPGERTACEIDRVGRKRRKTIVVCRRRAGGGEID